MSRLVIGYVDEAQAKAVEKILRDAVDVQPMLGPIDDLDALADAVRDGTDVEHDLHVTVSMHSGLEVPLHRKAPTTFFCNSLSDTFHEDVSPAFIAAALGVMAATPQHTYQLLTERPENILRMVPPSWLTSWPSHVWVGTTVEDQKRADQRIPHLLRVPARVRFLSCEPLLEEVNLHSVRDADGALLFPLERHRAEKLPPPYAGSRITDHPGLQWVIVGGESGSNARQFNMQWARDIVTQCRNAGVPVFVKQMGDNPWDGVLRETFTAHHGADPSEWPPELRVQEFPRVSP